MQEIVRKQANLSQEDKRKLVGVFAWLIKEDKKQNPAFYLPNKDKTI